MARRVFISFLGTNNYVECKYRLQDKCSKPVRFVQEALIEQVCEGWNTDDRIFIFCTSQEKTGEPGSKEINWLDNGQPRPAEDTERVGLEHRLQDLKTRMGLQPLIEQVDIEAGFSEEEIWNIFDVVYSKLEPGDQIYFDVTHAFRSIPLFSVVLFNYSKFMLDTRLVSIMYGAFEKLGPAYKVKTLPVEERVAPVIDLTNIVRLQEYNQMASNLKDFGQMKNFGEIIKSEATTPEQGQMPEKAVSSDRTIQDLAVSIKQLDEYIATIDLNNIKAGKFIVQFRNSYKNVKRKRRLIKPICNILDKLYEETADFVVEESFQNLKAAIDWTVKHNMLMQAFSLAQESVALELATRFRDLRPADMKKKKDYRE